MMYRDVRRKLESAGWAAADPRLWEALADNRPQIAFLAPPLDTIPSPSGNAIYCLVERLVERFGTRVLALAMAPPPGPGTCSAILDRLVYYHSPLKMKPWLRLLGYRLRKTLFGTANPEYIEYGRKAGHALRAMDVRTIVVEDMPMVAHGVAAAAGRTTRLVLHQHASGILGLPPQHWRKACRALRGIVFVARDTLEQSQARHSFYSVPAKVIHNGVCLQHYDPERWASSAVLLRTSLGIGSECTMLLFAGRLIPDKGIVEAAEAFLRARICNSTMIILGNAQVPQDAPSAYVKKLTNIMESSNGRVRLAGAVTQAELPKWYAAIDAVIVPSTGVEGLPKVVTEALAMGKPVLASDCGGSWELLRQEVNGWLIKDPRDIELTASLIREALSNKQRLARMSQEIVMRDRPLMSEDRMIKEFAETLAEWCPAHY